MAKDEKLPTLMPSQNLTVPSAVRSSFQSALVQFNRSTMGRLSQVPKATPNALVQRRGARVEDQMRHLNLLGLCFHSQVEDEVAILGGVGSRGAVLLQTLPSDIFGADALDDERCLTK